jgi:hypothetical protein
MSPPTHPEVVHGAAEDCQVERKLYEVVHGVAEDCQVERKLVELQEL